MARVRYSDPGAFGLLCFASACKKFGGKLLSCCELIIQDLLKYIDHFASFSDNIWGEGMAPYILGSDGSALAAPPCLAHTPR